MELIKLSFVEHAGMLDQVIRPYDLDMRGSPVDLFSKATENGLQLGAKRLAGVAAPLMGPSARRKIEAQAPNGWDHNRIMFAMVVATASRNNSKEFSYIVGYTDDAAYTKRGTTAKFDANMKMYFNNITRIHMTEAMVMQDRRHTSRWQPKIITHDQILTKSAIQGFEQRRGIRREQTLTLRPTDLFTRQGGESAFGSYLQDKDVPVKNLCGAFSGQLRSSTRVNNSSTNFMQRSLNAYVSAAADPSSAFIDDNNDHDTIQSALDSVIENSIDNDPYIEEIRRDSNILESGYITFGELMDLNPNFDEDRQLPFIPLDDKRKRSRITDNIVSFNSDEPESLAATMIAQALPGILIQSMYSSVSDMVISTRARVGESRLKSAFPSPFVEGMSISASWAYFEDQVDSILITEVSKNGMFDFEAKIDANIDQDIRIWISLDGGEEAYFEFPAFCDSLLAPTQSNSMEQFDLLSKGVVDLAGNLSRSRLRSAPSHVAEPVILTGTDVRSARLSSDRPSRKSGTSW